MGNIEKWAAKGKTRRNYGLEEGIRFDTGSNERNYAYEGKKKKKKKKKQNVGVC